MESILVLSTLQNVQKELDAIRNLVLPELSKDAAHYGESLDLVDLKWGSDSSGISKAENTNLINPDYIQKYRFPIVLLGDSYDWIPGTETGMENPLDMTDLEVQLGILAEENPNALFYFREPADPNKLPENLKNIYKPEDEEYRKRLEEIRNRLTENYPERIRHYQLEWDEAADSFRIPDQFALMLLWDLTELFESEFISTGELTWQDRLEQDNWHQIEEKSLLFSARQDELDEILSELKKAKQYEVLTN